MKKMTIPAWLKSGPVRGLLQVLLWCVALTFLMVVLYTFDSRGELHERMVQWRIPLLVWRLASGAVLYSHHPVAVAGGTAATLCWPGQILRSSESPFCSVSHRNYPRPADCVF